MMGYPTRWIDRLFLILWDIVWHIALPLALIYLWRRGRKEPLYCRHLGERFGGGAVAAPGAIWIHVVSLGETRAARPLIDRLLAEGNHILITNTTAAGRAETMSLFAKPIAAGRVTLRWSPIELSWACQRFMRKHRPAFGMIMEIELWPQMIASANRARVPLVMAQAQYPEKSFARDQGGFGLRAHLIGGFDLILAKSERHAGRFRAFGARAVQVMGELRFEQPIPKAQLSAAHHLRGQIAPDRPVYCLASTAPDEDPLLIPVLLQLREAAKRAGRAQPFFVYVPRHPKDFDQTAQKLAAAGLVLARRSKALDPDLVPMTPLSEDTDGLFGDSLGEIYFYFALSDRVFMGDSFNGEGSHNIIEPLSVGKSVVVGPSIWGIEFPALEALEEGVLTRVQTPQQIVDLWMIDDAAQQTAAIAPFVSRCGGATDRVIAQLRKAGFISADLG